MGQDGTASQNSDANQRTKQLVRKKLGLDKTFSDPQYHLQKFKENND